MHFVRQIVYRCREMMNILPWLIEKMQCKPKRAAPANTGQRAYSFHSVLQNFRWIFIRHEITLLCGPNRER